MTQIDSDILNKLETLAKERGISVSELLSSFLTAASQDERPFHVDHYQAFLDQTADVIFVTDRDGTFLDVNQAGLDLFGYTREEVTELNASDFYMYPEDRERILKALAEQGSLTHYEVTLKKKDGSRVHCQVSSMVQRDSQGEVSSIHGIARDITTIKQALASVHENEARLRQAFNVAHIGIWEWFLDDDRTSWDGDMFRMYGITPEEFTGKGSDYFNYTHPDDKQMQQDYIRLAFEHGVTEQQLIDGSVDIPYNPREFRIVRPDGSVCHVRGDAVAVVDDEGNPVRMVGVLHDVTDLHEVQHNLEERLHFEQIVTFVSTLLLMWTPDSQDDVLHQITALIATYLNVDRSTMFMIDDKQELKLLAIWRREGVEQRGSDAPQTDYPWYTRQIVENDICCYLVKDLPAEAANERQFCEELGIKSNMSIRLKAGDRVLGGFTFDSLSRDYEWWTGELLQRLQTIGEIISMGLLRQQIATDLRRRNTELGAFLDIAQAIGGNLELDTILNVFLEKLLTLVPYESGSIAFVEDDKLRFVASKGIPESVDLHQLGINLSEQQEGRHLFPVDELVYHGDVHEVEGWVQFPGVAYIRSWIGIPLRHKERLLGVLNLDHSMPHFFTPDHIRNAEAVSNHLAMTLEHAQLVNHLEERVTEQTQQLRESEERHRLISEIMSDYVYSATVNEEGVADLDWVFGAFEEITGYTLAEIQAMPARWISVIHDEDIARLGVLSGEFQPENSHVLEYRITTKDGKTRWLRDYFRMIWENGQIVRYLGAVEDITRTKSAELTLKTEQMQREIILSNIADAILFTDNDGIIVYANPAWEKLTGYALTEVAGQPSHLLQSGQTPMTVYEELWETISAGAEWTGVLRNKRKDGSVYDALATIVPVVDSDGSIINFVEVQRDVTEERQLAELQESFISNAAHDLRNPIIILTNTLYLMKHKPEKMDTWVDTLTAQVGRLNRLVTDLLIISRLDRQLMSPDLTVVHINKMIEHVVNAQQVLTTDKQQTLSTKLTPQATDILADAAHIERLLVNLIANAMNYTPPGGTIHISTRVSGDMLYIEVNDDGIGISADDIPHIFDRFYRAENAKSQGHGTGLGLAIVKDIVELNNGHISVHSEPDKGTTFQVRFPLFID